MIIICYYFCANPSHTLLVRTNYNSWILNRIWNKTIKELLFSYFYGRVSVRVEFEKLGDQLFCIVNCFNSHNIIYNYNCLCVEYNYKARERTTPRISNFRLDRAFQLFLSHTGFRPNCKLVNDTNNWVTISLWLVVFCKTIMSSRKSITLLGFFSFRLCAEAGLKLSFI